MKKRILGILLCLIMAVGMTPNDGDGAGNRAGI